MATKVTVTPRRPSSARNSRTKSTNALAFSADEHVGHALAHRERFALHVMMREHLAARQHFLEGHQHLLQRHLGRDAHDLAVDQLRLRDPGVALEPRHAVDALGGPLEALVFLQAAHQLGARIGLLGGVRRMQPRQQHARLDLGESGRHQQVLAGELELQHLHQLDVAHVLAA